MSRKLERIGNLIRNTVGEIVLTKIYDPRIDSARTSITRVEVSEDLLTAKVFVSVIGTEAEHRRTLRGLAHASGHIQDLMMRQIKLRHTPILKFVLDEKFKKTLETLDLIRRAMDDINESKQPAPSDEDSEQEQH